MHASARAAQDKCGLALPLSERQVLGIVEVQPS